MPKILKNWESAEIFQKHGSRQKFFQGGQTRYFAYPFHVADDAMQIHVHKTLCPFYTITKMPEGDKGHTIPRNEGGKIPRAPNHYGDAKSLQGTP